MAVLPWGCSSGGSGGGAGGNGSTQCMQGQQIACACTGNVDGVQVCGTNGSYGACSCDSSSHGGTTGASGAGSATGGSSNSNGGGAAGAVSGAGASAGGTGSGGMGGGDTGGASSGGTAGATGAAGGGNDCNGLGESCVAATDCCNASAFGPFCYSPAVGVDGRCCNNFGGVCGGDDECCQLPCTDGKCCRPLGSVCGGDSTCCPDAGGNPVACVDHVAALGDLYCSYVDVGVACADDKECDGACENNQCCRLINGYCDPQKQDCCAGLTCQAFGQLYHCE